MESNTTQGYSPSLKSGTASPNKSLKLLRRDMKLFYEGLNKKKSYKIGMNGNDCILTSSDEEEEDDIEN